MCFYLLEWVVHPEFRIWKLRLVILIKLQRRRVYQHIFDGHWSFYQMLPITILFYLGHDFHILSLHRNAMSDPPYLTSIGPPFYLAHHNQIH